MVESNVETGSAVITISLIAAAVAIYAFTIRRRR